MGVFVICKWQSGLFATNQQCHRKEIVEEEIAEIKDRVRINLHTTWDLLLVFGLMDI